MLLLVVAQRLLHTNKISSLKSIIATKFALFVFLTIAVVSSSQAAPTTRALLPCAVPSTSSCCISGRVISVAGNNNNNNNKAYYYYSTPAGSIGVLRCRGGGDDLPVVVIKTTSNPQKSSRMSRLRDAIFPIYGEERKKFFLLGSIKFFIVLALVLSRDTKDTLIVTQCGAEAIAFLKVYGVLPAATAFIAIYSQMASMLEKKTLFYATCLPFFAFFALYDLIIFPNAAKIEPSVSLVMSYIVGGASAASSDGGRAVVASIISHWTSALYYVVAEVYASVSIGVLFWQFANDVVPVSQAKRMYPLFAQMSGLAPIFAGQYVVRYASRAKDFSTSMHRLNLMIVAAGVAISILYHITTNYIATSDESVALTAADTQQPGGFTKKKKKQKMSMVESGKFLAGSKYLRLISILVIGYGLSINFTEIMWKSLVKKKYPDALDYQRFMGNVSSILGISTIIVIFLGVQVIRLLGWKAGALATPATMAVLSIPFFACVLLGLDGSPTNLHISVMLGTILSLLSKTAKYAMFDPTTQMAYIPLDGESKVKGKAAIDVLGSRIGKSGGSFILQGLVLVFGNIINAAPAVMVVFYSVLFAWMAAANQLSSLFAAKTAISEATTSNKKD